MFLEFGYGMAKNARMIDPSFYYNNATSQWYSSTTNNPVSLDYMINSSNRWLSGNVISIQTGFILDIFKNLSVGFSAESPKILLWGSNVWGQTTYIGNQANYGIFKLWSEIKF